VAWRPHSKYDTPEGPDPEKPKGLGRGHAQKMKRLKPKKDNYSISYMKF